jgi:hypothetical protein
VWIRNPGICVRVRAVEVLAGIPAELVRLAYVVCVQDTDLGSNGGIRCYATRN